MRDRHSIDVQSADRAARDGEHHGDRGELYDPSPSGGERPTCPYRHGVCRLRECESGCGWAEEC